MSPRSFNFSINEVRKVLIIIIVKIKRGGEIIIIYKDKKTILTRTICIEWDRERNSLDSVKYKIS